MSLLQKIYNTMGGGLLGSTNPLTMRADFSGPMKTSSPLLNPYNWQSGMGGRGQKDEKEDPTSSIPDEGYSGGPPPVAGDAYMPGAPPSQTPGTQQGGYSFAPGLLPSGDQPTVSPEDVNAVLQTNPGGSSFQFTPQTAQVLNVVAGPESGGNYNIVYGGDQVPLTDMTIAQVQDYQKQMVNSGKPSGAAGKYQVIGGTLAGVVKEMGLDPHATKYTPAVQEAIGMHLLKRRGYDRYLRGEISKEQFVKNLSQEWAAIPRGPDNKSYYHKDGINKAGMTWNQMMELV